MKTIQVKHLTQNFNTRFEVSNRKCLICKKNFKFHGYRTEPDNNACSYCREMVDTWKSVYIDKDKDIALVNRRIYSIGAENTKWKGFGGAKIKVSFNDGREVITTNLWCGLDITEDWASMGLGDTASLEFVK